MTHEGLHTLRLGVSLGAIHDSAERHPPPNCHPDTRKAVRQINSIAKLHHLLFSDFTDLLVLVRQPSFKRLQSFCAVHPSPVRVLGAAFFFLEEREGEINRVMELNPTLRTKSMGVQLKAQGFITPSTAFLSYYH